jgi:hypothetical protein
METLTFCPVSKKNKRRTLFGKPDKMMHCQKRQGQLKRDWVKT